MFNPVLTLVSFFARRTKSNFIRKTNQIEKIQQDLLLNLVEAHKDTEFGRKHSFETIASIQAFQQQVPIHTYADLDPYIQRMAAGETHILTQANPIYFNITSGSTGRKKLIPVTADSRRMVAKASQVAMGFVIEAAAREQRPLGKILFPASANSLGKTEGGVDYAPVSNSDMRLNNTNNVLYRQIFSSPVEAHQISDLKSRHYVCLLFALREKNLRIFAETFPVLALRLCQYLENHAQDFIQDIRSGQIAAWLILEPDLRAKLEPQWTASIARAQELQTILETHGRLTPELVWPQLSFIVTARGGTSNFYFQRFPNYFGKTPIFGGTYASAEATYGVHRAFNTDGVLLALESGFFEFIPEDQWSEKQPKTCLPWEVTPGERYRIIVTNYNGFYRYDVGDVVEVEGFLGKTPIFVFRYRYAGFITSVGEKTTEFHVTQVMNTLQHQFGCQLENFCITLSDDIPPRYLVNIELAPGEVLADPTAFLETFDQTLQQVHTMYKIKRRDQVTPPILRIFRSGSFEQLRTQLIQAGAIENQIKLPKISNDRDLFARMTVLQETLLDTCTSS